MENSEEEKRKNLIQQNQDNEHNVGITIEDLDRSPEDAVKDMDEMESSFGDVEKQVKADTEKVEKSVEENAEELDAEDAKNESIDSNQPIPSEPIPSEPIPSEPTPSATPSAPITQANIPTSVSELSAASKMDSKTKGEMQKILAELRDKMGEIDKLTKELKEKKDELSKTPPEKTEKLLEEIEVPSLEMLK